MSHQMAEVLNVLFLCTGNSARSIIAEVVLNELGKGRFKGYSAGSHPRGDVHPMTLEALQAQGYDTGSLRSKSHGNVIGLPFAGDARLREDRCGYQERREYPEDSLFHRGY